MEVTHAIARLVSGGCVLSVDSDNTAALEAEKREEEARVFATQADTELQLKSGTGHKDPP